MTNTPEDAHPPEVSARVAWDDYRAAADAAGVSVRMVTTQDAWAAATLLEEIWGVAPVEAPMLIAMARSGNYAAVAVGLRDSDRDSILAATAGYFAQPLGAALHSHVSGIRAGTEGRGIGHVMKLHQRAWCLDLGITEVTWTFDPLVARNAHINLARLGAQIEKYVIDYYGDMTDGLNTGQGSDRAVVRWSLLRSLPHGSPATPQHSPSATAALSVAPDGAPLSHPLPASAREATVAVPPDVEALRAHDPRAAMAWRAALRGTLSELLEAGWKVSAFATITGYYLERDLDL